MWGVLDTGEPTSEAELWRGILQWQGDSDRGALGPLPRVLEQSSLTAARQVLNSGPQT